ncbi:hypothetical protein [Nonomuraea sp. NPDC050643]|uniref:hypothetical protein n=1 Tax=Nonomuraea sp. NPDC050643 TaxID=3155660 RepID=UPI0034081297
MDRLPVVRLPGHQTEAGSIMQWRQKPDGQWEALVEWVEDVPGYRGDLEPRQTWFPAQSVEPVKGENYSRVPRTYA